MYQMCINDEDVEIHVTTLSRISRSMSWIANMCKQMHNLGYEVTDVYSAFESAEEHLINGDGAPSFIADPHPNAAGHQLIAETYYSTIAAAA